MALNIYEIFKRYRHKRLLCLVLLFILWYAIKLYLLDYFFTATFKQHQVWYPNFYLPTFLGAKLLHGLLYSVWLLLVLPKRAFKNNRILIVFIIAMAVSLLLQLIDFSIVKILFLPLVVIEIATWSFPLILNTWSFLIKKKHTTTYGFLLTYILLCLIVPDHFLPFYEFSMFNAMEPKAKVILFRNTNGEVVPLTSFTNASVHELGVIYEMQNAKGVANSKIGREILNHAMQFPTSKGVVVPQQVCVRHFWVQGNNLIETEILLYEVEF